METPYYTTRRTLQGRWAVVHRVPGADVDRIDVECVTLKAAWTLACDWNDQRECGWQVRNVMEQA